MKKIIKSLRFFTVFMTVIAFCFTFIYVSDGSSLYAQGGKIKVYIDAGHGGSDPGAVRFGLNEKDANLDIALRLKSKLEANGYAVVMTRTKDAYSTLDDRVNKANSSGADIFISVHNNAALSEYAHGTETYWCANGVTGSSQLAGYVQNNLVKQIGRANRGVKTANFRVIKYTKMPAALVECAFVSNPTEAALLKTADFREKCALGLYKGIAAFAKGLDKSSESSGSSGSSESSGSSSNNYSDSSGKESKGFTVRVLEPENNSIVYNDFAIKGWAADVKNSSPLKLTKVELYRGPERTEDNLLASITSFKNNILGATGIINGGWEKTIEISKLNDGENIIYVYAYDKNNNYSQANVKINVIKDGEPPAEENVAPVADAGGPYSGAVDEEITFDGSGSSDSDGEIAEYIWDFGDGETGSGVEPVHAYAEAGEYTVTLTVKDDSDAVSEEVTTTAAIEDADDSGGDEEGTGEDKQVSEEDADEEEEDQQIVAAEAGEDKTADTGEELTFDASGSTISPLEEGAVIAYSWDWNGDGEYDETLEEPVITHTYDKAGVYEVTLKVTAFEDVSSTDTLTVTINEPNKAPTANPGGPYTATAGKELTLDGSGSSDPDGTIKEYIWDFGDGETGSGAKPVHKYTEKGEYTVKLTVKDDKGAASETATTKVKVNEAEKTYPVNTSPITNSTNVVGYTEVTVDQLVKIFKDRNSTKIEWAKRIAPIYIKYGKLFNIRADIAWAMMCHETGFLTYTGIVPPNANNFCGLGATGEKDANGNYLYNSFATEELGVIAHYAHLAWYYYPGHVNTYCSLTYDPRHSSTHWRYTGNTTLGFLNGQWAPGTTYTSKIIQFANQIYGY